MALEPRGVNYEPAGLSSTAIERDLHAIRDELRCTAVLINGGEPERQRAAAECALALGLDVWIQSALENGTRSETIAQIAMVADTAETLRARHPGRVTLAVGNELTLFSR